MEISKSESETIKIASNIGKKLAHGGLLCLYGDLGSGKTVFTKGLAKSLNIPEFSVKSPTYTYIRRYLLPDGRNFYHIDLYRLDGPDELLARELTEILEIPENIVVIEWAEKMTEFLPEKRIDVQLKYSTAESREIDIYEQN